VSGNGERLLVGSVCDGAPSPQPRRERARLDAAWTTVRLLTVVLVSLLVVPGAARADPDLVVGVVDEQLKWTAQPQPTTAALRGLGIGALRVSLVWSPGESRLTQSDVLGMDRIIGATFPMRIVLTVTGPAADPPRTRERREQFCAYMRDALNRYPSVNDVTVWNEVNAYRFWRPQYVDGTSVGPRDYVALLARCYDTLHTLRPEVNVMTDTAARGGEATSPRPTSGHWSGEFIRKMGAAYRASERTRRLFDNAGHHPYGDSSVEPPFARHPRRGSIGEGDYDALVDAYADAFTGTGQPAIGRDTRVYYLEAGFESTIDPAKRPLYVGREEAETIGARVRHGDQLIDAVRLAYCQRHVASFFNFLLTDDQRLDGWQSGLLWPDGSKKPAYYAFRYVVREVKQRAVNCAMVRRQQKSNER
jgi:hypothetical protein